MHYFLIFKKYVYVTRYHFSLLWNIFPCPIISLDIQPSLFFNTKLTAVLSKLSAKITKRAIITAWCVQENLFVGITQKLQSLWHVTLDHLIPYNWSISVKKRILLHELHLHQNFHRHIQTFSHHCSYQGLLERPNIDSSDIW